MCVNYQLPLFGTYRVHFDAPDPEFDSKPEAYPMYTAPIVISSPDRVMERDTVRAVFGLIPHWAKDEKVSRNLYNARSETVATKPSFRTTWKDRHWCLVPAQAIFEPNYESGKAERWRIFRKDGKPFAVAGMWATWRKGEERVRSFTMLTINADEHPLMRRFHAPGDEKRSVVLLPEDSYQRWLDAADDGEARDLLQPFNPDEYTAEPAPQKRKGKIEPAAEARDDLL